MQQYNYVQDVWEQRFQIHRQTPGSSRFVMGFVIGAAITGALVLYAVTNTSFL